MNVFDFCNCRDANCSELYTNILSGWLGDTVTHKRSHLNPYREHTTIRPSKWIVWMCCSRTNTNTNKKTTDCFNFNLNISKYDRIEKGRKRPREVESGMPFKNISLISFVNAILFFKNIWNTSCLIINAYSRVMAHAIIV